MPPRIVTFDAALERAPDQDAAWLDVPFDVRSTFGRARPPVNVTLNGYSFRTTIMTYGGRSLIGVNKAHRSAAGIAAGDRVHVTVTEDADARVVAIPVDLADALAGADARDAFDRLPYTRRLEVVRSLESAKRPETRRRRLDAAVEELARDPRP